MKRRKFAQTYIKVNHLGLSVDQGHILYGFIRDYFFNFGGISNRHFQLLRFTKVMRRNSDLILLLELYQFGSNNREISGKFRKVIKLFLLDLN